MYQPLISGLNSGPSVLDYALCLSRCRPVRVGLQGDIASWVQCQQQVLFAKEVVGYFKMKGEAYAPDASQDLMPDYELVCRIMDDLEKEGQMVATF